MKRVYTTIVWALCCFVWLIPTEVNATHIVGGDLTYRCLGNNLYEIRLTLRRDCFLGAPEAQFDDPASIGFFDAGTGQFLPFIGTNGQLLMPFNDDDTLNQEFISDCTISGFDVCVQQTTYVDTIQLPFLQNGYILTYTRCCRNNTIQNIEDPIGTGMSLVTIISGPAQQTCNSSPVLGEYPPIYICVNEPINFDFSVETDPQGDSVVYQLFSPFVGGSIAFPMPQPPSPPPYDTVVYIDPFSLDDLLGNPADPLSIDPQTGLLTGTPLITGQFVAGVRIFSYNSDGVLIEATSREWQYNVRQCREQPVANYDVSAELNCNDLSLTFTDLSVGTELDITWFFDYGNPDGDTSTDPDVTYTWDEPGFYDVALIVTTPDSICFDTLVGEVGVFESMIDAEFDFDVLECGTDSIVFQVTDVSIEPDVNYEIDRWEWYVVLSGDTLNVDSAQNPQFTVDTALLGVEITLIAFSENGCSDTATSIVDLNIIEIPFQTVGLDTIGLCEGDTVALFPFPGDSNYTYTWTPLEGLDITRPWDPQAFPDTTTEYFVTVTDGFCEVGGEIVVAVEDVPTLAFDAITDCRDLEVDFINNSIGGFAFEWDFGEGTPPSFEMNPTHIYNQPGTYTVSLISADGCDVATAEVVAVASILDSVDNTSISCFAEDVELNPDGDTSLYTYEWTPADGLNDAMSGNPTASVDTTTIFYVTITDIENPGCFVVDSVEVIVPGDFSLEAPPDSAYCGAPEITLDAGNDGLDYTWTDLDGNLLSDNGELTVQPTDTMSYILTGVDAFGCSKTDTVTLEPTFFMYTLSPDVVLCEGDDTIIFVTNMDPNQDITFEWMPEEFIDGPNDISNPTVIPEGDQIFTVLITNNTLGCMVEEQITVSVSDFDYTISGDDIVCLGECITLNITSNDTTVLDYLWAPDDGSIESGGDGPTPNVCPEVPTLYTVQILNTDYGCMTNDSVFVDVSWFDPDVLEIFVEPDTIIANNNEFFEISTNQDEDLDYMWSGEGIVDPPTTPVIMASPTEEGMYMYSVTVTNADGCQLTGQTSSGLTVLDPDCDMSDVFIPSAFSPNGDGRNDEFGVYSNFEVDMELIVYNRWGEEVFRSNDQDNPWDGTFEGEKLAPDVFGYYLRVTCPPNKEYMTQGNVTLIR